MKKRIATIIIPAVLIFVAASGVFAQDQAQPCCDKCAKVGKEQTKKCICEACAKGKKDPKCECGCNTKEGCDLKKCGDCAKEKKAETKPETKPCCDKGKDAAK